VGSLRKAAVMLALVVALLAPTMACALPNAQMTAQEHACCRKMKGDCGRMRMPASHGCCQQNIQANNLDALQPQSASVSSPAVAVLPVYAALDVIADTYERVSWPQHLPPISPPQTASILRI
jgi:hypothetical protein